MAGRRSSSIHWDWRSACIYHMDGGAADQQGGRSDGAFPGDGRPGTLDGGSSRTYHWDGWADIICSRRRSSAEAKQQGAVQRLGLGSRLQQGTVLQNAGARKRVALEEEDRVKLDRWMTKPVHKVRTMFPNIPILSIHHVIHLQCHPFTMSFIHHYGPCHPLTMPSFHIFIHSPFHQFTMSSIQHVIHSPSWSMLSIYHAIHSQCHPVTSSSIHHIIHSPCHPFTMSSIHHAIQSPCHPVTITSINQGNFSKVLPLYFFLQYLLLDQS